MSDILKLEKDILSEYLKCKMNIGKRYMYNTFHIIPDDLQDRFFILFEGHAVYTIPADLFLLNIDFSDIKPESIRKMFDFEGYEQADDFIIKEYGNVTTKIYTNYEYDINVKIDVRFLKYLKDYDAVLIKDKKEPVFFMKDGIVQAMILPIV